MDGAILFKRAGHNIAMAFLAFAIFIAVFFHCITALASEPVVLKSTPDFYVPLTPHLEVFEEGPERLTVEQVHDLRDKFLPVTTRYPDFGLKEGRIWIRAEMRNNSAEDGVWRLDINRQYYRYIDVYGVSETSEFSPILTYGNDNSFNDRPIADRMLVTDMTIAAGHSLDLYISFKSDSTTYIPIGIGTAEAVVKRRAEENTINWVLNGALLAMIAFSLMMIPIIGLRLALSFSLYIFAGFLYVFHADGYTFQYIWPGLPMGINDPLNLSFIVFMPLCGLLFSRVMFDFKKFAPFFDRYLMALILVSGFVVIFAFPIYQSQSLKVLAYLMTPLASITQVVAGCVAMRRKLLGAVPFTLGAFIVLTSLLYATLAHLAPGNYNLDHTLDYGHMTLLAECLAFAAAIVIRLSGLRAERDSALKAELSLTQDKLQLSADLQASQANYIHARKMSDIRRNQLSSVSHDLQQPLASLRQALSKMGGADEDAKQQMHSAFDYLESLARDQITAGQRSMATTHLDGRLEQFPIRTLLDNVREMFKDEAAAKGLEFRYRPVDANITSDPIGLMRAISNLVSNAIKHTEKGGLLLAARPRQGRLRIEVWDTGVGMSADELEQFSERHVMSEHSTGSGLGLAIVSEISNALDIGFQLHSTPGKGTAAFLYLPLSD